MANYINRYLVVVQKEHIAYGIIIIIASIFVARLAVFFYKKN